MTKFPLAEVLFAYSILRGTIPFDVTPQELARKIATSGTEIYNEKQPTEKADLETAAIADARKSSPKLLGPIVIQKRGILLALVLSASVHVAFVTWVLCFQLAYDADNLYTKRSSSERIVFNANVDIPLYYTGVLWFFFKSAVALRNQQATRLDSLAYASPIFLVVQWAMCARWLEVTEAVDTISHRVIFGTSAAKGSALFEALPIELSGKIVYCLFVATLVIGYFVMNLVFTILGSVIGGTALVHIYIRFKEPVAHAWRQGPRQYLRKPAIYVVRVLQHHFPGPSTKSKADANPFDAWWQWVTWVSTAGIVFVGFTSVVLLTIPDADEEDVLSVAKKKMHFNTHVAIFYGLVMWMAWRGVSAMNFAPTVRIDRLVYTSRLGWMVQIIISLPWPYTLWKILYFPFQAAVMKRGPVGTAIKAFGPSLWIFSDVVLYLAGNVLTVGVCAFAGAVVQAQLVCMKELGRMAHQMIGKFWIPRR